jgi:hypothetical protein
MHRRRLSAFVAVGALYFPCAVYGQFSDPRTYANTPVGVNQLELDYAHATTNASIDTSLVIGGAHLEVNEATVAYTRTFGIVGHSAWIKPSVPFAYVSGSVAGSGLSRSVAGAGDASLQLATLLLGGPALNVSDFEKYEPTTTVGVSLTVSGPTGQYDPNRVLNLGSDRWSFKPEIGISHPFGPDQKWVVDGHFYTYFFTDNTEYHGKEILRQQALPGFEAHISYNITPDLWTSLDANYAFRGTTFVDGVDQNDAQKNLTLGTETNWTLNSRNSIAFLFAKSVVHVNAPIFTQVALKYFYSWGAGL